jgi:hypothetical protein
VREQKSVIGGKMLAMNPYNGISAKLVRIQRKVLGGNVIIHNITKGRFTTKEITLFIPGGNTSQKPSIFCCISLRNAIISP